MQTEETGDGALRVTTRQRQSQAQRVAPDAGRPCDIGERDTALADFGLDVLGMPIFHDAMFSPLWLMCLHH